MKDMLLPSMSMAVIRQGGRGAGDPPLTIPNREVKPRSADGTGKPGEQGAAPVEGKASEGHLRGLLFFCAIGRLAPCRLFSCVLSQGRLPAHPRSCISACPRYCEWGNAVFLLLKSNFWDSCELIGTLSCLTTHQERHCGVPDSEMQEKFMNVIKKICSKQAIKREICK